MDNPEAYSPVGSSATHTHGAPGPDPAALLDLVGLFQDAALEPSLWRAALERLRLAFGGRYASMTTTTAGPPVLVLQEVHVGMQPPPETVEEFTALQEQDPRIQWAMNNFGRAGASNIHVGMERLRASAVYQHVLAPLQIEYTLMLPELVDSRVACTLTVDRAPSQPPFQASDVAALQTIEPHFRRALRTQLRLGQRDAMVADLRDTLARLPLGVLIVDDRGRVRFASAIAETLLGAKDGLSIERGELVADAYGPGRRLQGAIAQALTAARGEEAQVEDTLTVKRNSGRRDFELLVAPLRADRAGPFPREPAALVLISDPETSQPLPWQVIQQLYGLSPAESRLAAALSRGASLKDYAKRTGISVETARSQLKAAMSKTRTHRQAELIQRLLAGPAAFGLEDSEEG